jgi:hypothetical protein
MEFRKSQWTESISSLLRKTELNLIRIQTPFHEEYPRNCGSATYHTSFYDNGEAIQRPPTDFKDFKDTKDFREDSVPQIQQEIISVKNSIEKMLNERLKSQKKDIENIGDRLTNLEVRSTDLDRFKEETKISLNNIEKRCQSEIKRIEQSAKGFVTKEDLNIAVDSLSKASLNSFKGLEREIESIKSGDFDVKQEVFRMAEDKMRDVSKKFVSLNEFTLFKEGVLSEYDDRMKNLEQAIDLRLEKFKSSYEREETVFEKKVFDLKHNFDEREEKITRKIQEVEKNLEKTSKKHQEEKAGLSQEIEKLAGMIDVTELEYRLDALETSLNRLPKQVVQPDLSGLAQKQDLAGLQSKLADLEVYKKNLDQRIFEIERKVQELESAESSEIDADLGGPMKGVTFGKLEEEKKTSAFTNINIENFGESDSDSQYISPHTSPMNQLNILKKPGDFEIKAKSDLPKRKTDLIVVDEDPDIENKDNSYSKPAKKTEVKHFPVENVKVESKKSFEDSGKLFKSKENIEENFKGKKEEPVKGLKENKGINLFIPEPDLKKSESNSSDSESSDFGLGLSNKAPKPLTKPSQLEVKGKSEIPAKITKPVQSPLKIEDDEDEFGFSFAPILKQQKPALNPIQAKNTSQKVEEIKIVQKNEDLQVSGLVDSQFELFVANEIKICVDQLKVGIFGKALVEKSLVESAKPVPKKIPDSIKGMNMQNFLSRESSSGSFSGESGGSSEKSGSGSGSNSDVDFNQSIESLP